MSNILPRNAKTFKDNSLVIYSANEYNGGYYECEGKDERMNTFHAEVKLDVFSEFIPSSHPCPLLLPTLLPPHLRKADDARFLSCRMLGTLIDSMH